MGALGGEQVHPRLRGPGRMARLRLQQERGLGAHAGRLAHRGRRMRPRRRRPRRPRGRLQARRPEADRDRRDELQEGPPLHDRRRRPRQRMRGVVREGARQGAARGVRRRARRRARRGRRGRHRRRRALDRRRGGRAHAGRRARDRPVPRGVVVHGRPRRPPQAGVARCEGGRRGRSAAGAGPGRARPHRRTRRGW